MCCVHSTPVVTTLSVHTEVTCLYILLQMFLLYRDPKGDNVMSNFNIAGNKNTSQF